MLSGSAVLRVSVLLVVAALLAALVQFLLPHAATEPAPAGAPATRPVRSASGANVPVPPEPRRIEPTAAPPAPVRSPAVDEAVPPAPVAPRPDPAPVAPVPSPAAAQAASDSAGPRALALVDLNTGSLAELNGLRGGGSIGRAIVQRRPYAAIDQLLSKRVLSRATYDRIKDQVTVR